MAGMVEYAVTHPAGDERQLAEALRTALGPGELFLRGAGCLLAQVAGTTDLTTALPGVAVTRVGSPTDPLAGGAFGGPALASLTRGFLADVSAPLLDVMATARNRTELLGAAVDVMIAHLAAVNVGAVNVGAAKRPVTNGAPLSFLSYRSHADGFFVMARDPGAARRAFDERYAAIAPAMRARTTTILEGPADVPAPASWYRSVTGFLPAATAAFRSGELTGDDGAEGYLGSEMDLSGSDFHRTIDENQDFVRFLRSDPPMLAVRLATSLLYLSLHDIGLRLVDRYFLCHAISRAVESIFDVDAVELLATVVSR